MRHGLAWWLVALAAIGCASGSHIATGDGDTGAGGTLTGSGSGGGSTGGSPAATSASSSGGAAPGLALGDECSKDAECSSKLCKPVVIGSSPVCVSPCTKQSDCGLSDNFFCDPLTA